MHKSNKNQLSERLKNRVLIRHLHEQGKSVSEIKSELNVAESTIRRWINRENICDDPRSGRRR